MSLPMIAGDKKRRRPVGIALSEQEINSVLARDDGEEDGSGESDWDNLGEEEMSPALPRASGVPTGGTAAAAAAVPGCPASTSSAAVSLPANSTQRPESSRPVISDVGVDALFGSCRSNLPAQAEESERQPGGSQLVDSLFGAQSDSDMDEGGDLPRCEDDDERDFGLSEQGACISRSLASARRSVKETKVEREVRQYLAQEPGLPSRTPSCPSSRPAGTESSVSSALAASAARRKKALAELSTSLPNGACVQPATSGPAGAGLGDSTDSWIAVPSRLRVHRPRISSELWLARTGERQVVTLLQFLNRHLASAGQPGPRRRGADGDKAQLEVLVGVIGAKLPPRRSKNDRVYSVWTLSDLDRVGPGAPGGCVKLFLFGSCHDKLWKESEGSVVAVLGPKLMSDGGSSSNGKDVSITLESPQHVMLLGQSPDFAVCAARAEVNGRACFRVVNKSVCRYCDFHVKKAYYQASTSRPGFVVTSNNTFSQRGRLSQYAGDRQRPHCDPGVYSLPTTQSVPAGNMSIQGRPLSIGRVKLNMSKLSAAGYQVDASIGLTGRKGSGDAADESDPVAEPAGTRGSSTKSLTSPERKLLMALRRPTAGSLNLLRHLDASQTEDQRAGLPKSADSSSSPSLSSTSSKPTTTALPPQQAGTATFAKFFASAAQHQRSPSLPVTPRGSKRALPTDFIDLGPLPSGSTSAASSVPNALVNSAARRRATALVKFKGGATVMQAEEVGRRRAEVLAKSDSSRTARHSPLSQILDNNRNNKADEALSRSGDDSKDSPGVLAREKRAKRLAELASRISQGSSHTALVEEVENESELARLVQLEKRDDLQQRLLDQQEEPCTYVECRTCKYRAWKAAPQCRRDKHTLSYLKGTKRYYRCRHCTTRTATFDRYPKLSCSNCGESLFEKTSIIPERRGPDLPGEKLLPRGVEEKFMS